MLDRLAQEKDMDESGARWATGSLYGGEVVSLPWIFGLTQTLSSSAGMEPVCVFSIRLRI